MQLDAKRFDLTRAEYEAKKAALPEAYMPISFLAKRDEDRTFAMIEMILLWAVTKLNVKSPLTDLQRQELAILIARDVDSKSLSLEHLCISMLQGVKGASGQVFDRLDVGVVFGWVKAYQTHVTNLIVLEQENRHFATKESRQNALTDADKMSSKLYRLLDGVSSLKK